MSSASLKLRRLDTSSGSGWITVFCPTSGDPEQETEEEGHSAHRLDSSSRLVTADTEEIFLYHRQKIFNHRKIFIAGVSGVRMVIAMMG